MKNEEYECNKCDSKYTKFLNPNTRNLLIETLIHSILFYLISNKDARSYIMKFTTYVDLLSTVVFAVLFNVIKCITRRT